ncbi:hypothetical protein P8452_17426 [Trifolium repens]|nr:hypothetical protein P8452_17426 [Trifolium repens]
MAGGGKSKEVLDLIYEQNRGPGSRRNVRRDPDWSAAEDAAIIQGVDKYAALPTRSLNLVHAAWTVLAVRAYDTGYLS